MQGFETLSLEAEQYLGITLSQEQLHDLDRYADLLVEWNQKINLTAIRSAEEIRIKHFLDSLSCVLAIKGGPSSRIIDIGSGAGFPGLPLKIFYQGAKLTLVESVTKKTNFLTQVVQELGLNQVEVLDVRAETIGQQPSHRESYDWAIARAVAALPVLSEFLLPLVRVGGFMLAQKGEGAGHELEQAQPAIDTLGGKHIETIKVDLPGLPQERYLIVIEKIAPTPQKYPRREGMPAKRPLGN